MDNSPVNFTIKVIQKSSAGNLTLTSFLHLSIGIFAHSSYANASSSVMFDGFHAATAFLNPTKHFKV